MSFFLIVEIPAEKQTKDYETTNKINFSPGSWKKDRDTEKNRRQIEKTRMIDNHDITAPVLEQVTSLMAQATWAIFSNYYILGTQHYLINLKPASLHLWHF